MAISVFYDGDCPFCTKYVQVVRLQDAIGPVELVDLRENEAARERMLAAGFEPDQGMAIEIDGQLRHGADAMNAISLMSTDSGVLNRMSAAIFRHKTASRVLYPVLRAGRNLTLFAMGRQALREPDPGEAGVFELFARAFGLFALLHAIYAALYLGALVTTFAMFLFGAAVFLVPRSRRVFLLLVGALVLDAIARGPTLSNHTIITNFLLLAMIVAGIWFWLRGASWETWFKSVRPSGRCLLLTMYVFGVFHKINSDFLDPEVSCAVVLWRKMPAALNWLDNPAMHYAAIYGTFAVEGAIFVALLVPRWRHWGIVGGILFHGLLAFSSYQFYSPFSTLSIALHTLFIAPVAARRITEHDLYRSFDQALRRPLGVAAALAVIALLFLAIVTDDFARGAIYWAMLVLGPAGLVLLLGRVPADEGREPRFLRSSIPALNLLSVLFFLNCLSPYLGLKSAQSINMFANIRLEGGRSNHLLFSSPPGPFTYLDDVVTIEAAERAPALSYYVGNEKEGLVYYQFLSLLAQTPGATVSYTLNGKPFADVKAREVLAQDGALLHPEWVRSFFHFKPVYLQSPVPCGNA